MVLPQSNQPTNQTNKQIQVSNAPGVKQPHFDNLKCCRHAKKVALRLATVWDAAMAKSAQVLSMLLLLSQSKTGASNNGGSVPFRQYRVYKEDRLGFECRRLLAIEKGTERKQLVGQQVFWLLLLLRLSFST